MTDTAQAIEPAAPPPGVYEVDPAHSSVTFVARHLIGSKVRGQFSRFSGTITVIEPPESSFVEAEVEAGSLGTGVDQRDQHVLSGDFLDVEHHPKLVLRSTGLAHLGGSGWRMPTELTIRGVTRPVELDLEYLGSGPGMTAGSVVAAFSASAEIDRRDFDVSFSGVLESGGLVVGNKVRIELEIEAARK